MGEGKTLVLKNIYSSTAEDLSVSRAEDIACVTTLSFPLVLCEALLSFIRIIQFHVFSIYNHS